MSYSNILTEEKLKETINFITIFTLYFECLKDFVVENLREFYADEISLEKDEKTINESERYKECVRRKNTKHLDSASMMWFEEAGAISAEDVKLYDIARSKRNAYIHEMEELIWNGVSGDDLDILAKMIALYNKLDRWWINEIEVPTSADNIPNEYDREGVIGGQALILRVISDVMVGNADDYKELLDELRKRGLADL